MIRLALLLPFVGLGLVAGRAQEGAPDDGPAPPPAAEAAASPDEAAIRALVAEFVRAYNAGDAPAIAALCTDDAQITAEEGRAVTGRAAIEERFADDPEAAADPEVVLEAFEELDPPDEIADDFDAMLEASRNIADVDQSDPEAMADAQAEIESATEAQERVSAYLDEECGISPGG